MKFKVNWVVLIVIKLILSSFKLKYKFWQRLNIFRHGAMDNSDYAIKIFNNHLKNVGLDNVADKTILELGPGDSVSTALMAATYEARSILIDAGEFASYNMNIYEDLYKILRTINPNFKLDFSKFSNIDQLLDSCNSKYLTAGIDSLKSIESNSIDIVLSQSVLQHIHLDEIKATIDECARILKPKGICSHEICIHDHLGGGLNNLRFPKKIWESKTFKKSGFYTNRLRYSNFIKLFIKSGFRVRIHGVKRWKYVPINIDNISKQFSNIKSGELKIYVFNVVLFKQ